MMAWKGYQLEKYGCMHEEMHLFMRAPSLPPFKPSHLNSNKEIMAWDMDKEVLLLEINMKRCHTWSLSLHGMEESTPFTCANFLDVPYGAIYFMPHNFLLYLIK